MFTQIKLNYFLSRKIIFTFCFFSSFIMFSQNYILNPLTEGSFEGTHGWTILNTDNVNKWVIGSAEKSAGSMGAYISNNNSTNTITNPQVSNSRVYIYKDVVVPLNATTISISFKYKNSGTDSPAPRCMFAPTSVYPTLPTNGSSYLVGAEFLTFLNNSTAWTSYSNTSPLTTDRSLTYTSGPLIPGESYRIVFEWSALYQTNRTQIAPFCTYPTSASFSGNMSPSPNSTETYTYNSVGGSNFLYTWSVDGGTIVSGQGTNQVRITFPSSFSIGYLRCSLSCPPPVYTTSGKNSGPLAIDEVAITYVATPKITSISPLSGAVGSSVTINGEFFGATTAENVVFLGGLKCAITAASATSLTVTVPVYSNFNNFTVLNTTTKLSCISSDEFVTKNTNLLNAKYLASTYTNNAFEAPITFTTGTFASSFDQKFVLADVDLDGKVDIFSYSSTGVPNILRNNATSGIINASTFVANATITGVIPTSPVPTSRNVFTADLNNDGKLDFANSNNNSVNGGFANMNTSNSGTPSLSAFNSLMSTTNQYKVNASFLPIDINLDGRTDILGLNGTSASQALLYFTKNTTTGTTFSSVTGKTTNTDSFNQKLSDTNFYSGASGDLDGDGKTDVVLSGIGKVYVLKNTTTQGNPDVKSFSFSEPVSKLNASGISYTVKVADLDLDGKLDVIATNTSSANVSVYRNISTGSSLSIMDAQNFALTGFSQTYGLAVADMNGDGKPDLIVSDNSYQIGYLENTSVSGTISFANSVTIISGVSQYPQLEVADIDGDNKLDIIAATTTNGIVVFRNRILEAGVIGSDQSICFSSATSRINSSKEAAFLSGTPIYKWQKSTSSPTSGYTDIAGVTTNYLDPGTVTTTTYYRRGAASTTATTLYFYSAPVTITVNALPTISSTTSNTICGTGSIPISAETSAGSNSFINWYDAATGGNLVVRNGSGIVYNTPDLTLNTTYYVQAEDANGCLSSTRTAVYANVNLALPVVTIGTFAATKCDSGSFKISATTSSEASIKWYDALTGGNLLQSGNNYITPVLYANATYYAEATNCNGSSTRVAVPLSLATTPSVTSAPSISICSSTPSVTLTAAASAGANYWYTAASGGTADPSNATINNITANTTRYVTAYIISNGLTCESPRTAVVATALASPTITNYTSTSVCGFSSNYYGVGTSTGTVNWYSDSGTTNLVATGTNFTAPASSLSQVYYAKASDITTGCSTVLTINVTNTGATVLPLSNAFALTNQDNFEITASGLSGQTSYSWQRFNGISWTTITSSMDGTTYSNFSGTTGTTASLMINKVLSSMHGFQYRLALNKTSCNASYSTSATLTIADVYGECPTTTIPVTTYTTTTAKTGLTNPSSVAFSNDSSKLNDSNNETGLIVTNTDTGTVNGGLVFDGVDDYVNIGQPAALQAITTAVTVEAWIKPNAFGNDFFKSPIVDKDQSFCLRVGSKVDQVYNPYQSWDGVCGCYVGGYDPVPTPGCITFTVANGSMNESLITSGNTIATGVWNHIAGVYDSTSRNIKIYLNGTLIGTQYNGQFTTMTNYSNLLLGSSVYGGDRIYNGAMDEVRIFNYAKTQAQIQATMNTADVTGATGLAAYYKFNEGVGTALIDQTANAGNGSLVNFALTGTASNWITTSPITDTQKIATITADFGSSTTVKAIKLAGFSNMKDGASTVRPSFSGGYIDFSNDGTTWTRVMNSIPSTADNGASFSVTPQATRYVRVRKLSATTGAYFGLSELSMTGSGYETVPYIRQGLPASSYTLTGTPFTQSINVTPISGQTISAYQWSSSTTTNNSSFANLTNTASQTGTTTNTLSINPYANATPTYYKATATQSNGCTVSTQVLANLETGPYYPIVAQVGALQNLASWTVNANGTAGSAPTGFIANKYFILKNSASTYGIGADWTNAGTLMLNGNKLSLTSTFSAIVDNISGFTSTAYVSTNGTGFLKSNVTNTPRVFPIGTTTGYNPVTITNNTGISDLFSARIHANDVTTPLSTNYIKKTWAIIRAANNTGGTNMDLKFEWNAADVAGTILDPELYYATATGTTVTWTKVPYTSMDKTSNSITCYGIVNILGSSVRYFMIKNATPTIASFTPTSAATGQSVVIKGTFFTGATAVTFGGTAATSFVINSATQITAVVASGTTGSVVVTTPIATLTLAGFTYLPAPTITSFTPTRTMNGATVTITGTNFANVTAVTIGGVAAVSYNVVSVTQITAVVNSGATSGSVSVTTTGGTATLSGFVFGVPAGTAPTFVAMPTINATLSEMVRAISPPISNSTGAFTYSLPTNTVASLSGTLLQFNTVGTTTLTVNQAATSDFTAGSTTATINVTTPPTILFPNQNKTVGDASSVLSATSNSSGAFTYTSSNTAVASVSGTNLLINSEGITEISASQAANGFYNASVEKAIVIVKNATKQTPTLSWVAPIYKAIDSPNFTLTAPTSSSPGPIAYYSSNSNVATVSGNLVTIIGEGTSVITAVQSSTSVFNAAQIGTQLIVQTASKTNPTISNFASYTKLITDGTFSVSAPTSTNSAAFTYSIANPDIAKISGTIITLVGVGVTRIIATQQASGIYNGGAIEATLTVTLPPLPAISYVSPSNYRRSTAITALNPTSTGGTIVSYSISPNLPLGLAFSTSTGAITGTPTVISDRQTYTVTARNVAGTGTATIQIGVIDIAPSGLAYTTPNVFTIGTTIATMSPTNSGSPIINFTISPSLPAGLVLNATTGEISGTPALAVSIATYTVTGTNSGGTVTFPIVITVNDKLPTLLEYSTPNVLFKGEQINPLTPSNSDGAISSYAVSPSLPSGLLIDSTTGKISGAPSVTSATTTYRVTGTNSAGSVYKDLSIMVNDNAPTNLVYTTPNNFTVGQAITTLTPTNQGGNPTSYSINTSLPDGLLFNTTTGEITGTPTTITANQTFVITALNFIGNASANVEIAINDLAPTNLSYTTPNVYSEGVAISSLTPTISGGVVLSYSISPSLPPGLIINSTTGVISGTPTSISAIQNYTVTATNSGGSTTFSISIKVNAAPAYLSSSLTPSPICSAASFNYVPTSLTADVTFSWSRATVVGISNLAGSGTGNISEQLINTTNLPIDVIYQIDVTNNGTLNTENVTVSVYPTLVVGTVTGTNTICLGNNSSTLQISGNLGSIQWESSTDGVAFSPVSGAQGSTLTITNLTSTRYYRVIVSNAACSSLISNVVTLTVGNTTTWNGTAWTDNAPTSNSTIIFTGNYTINANLSGCSLQVTNNAVVTLSSGFDVTLYGAVVVDSGSSFTLDSNSNLIQTSNVSNSGNIIVNRETSPLMRLDYVLWSTPVLGQQLFNFSPITLSNRFYTYNAETNLYNAVSSPSTTDFEIGKGYLIRMPNNHPTTPTLFSGAFTGIPNNGIVTLPVTTGSYNAIGNPYPSTIDADTFITSNSLTEALYFWRKTNNTLNPSYATYTLAGSTGTTANTGGLSNTVPNGIIQVGQGFIAKSVDTDFVFNNAMRIGNNDNQFLRNALTDKSRIWLNLTNTNGYFCQTMLGYMPEATQGIDPTLDGRYINDVQTALTSIINNEEFTIQGKALPFTDTDSVQLGFKTSTAGIYSISLDHFDGLFSSGQAIYLKDNVTNSVHDLRTSDYTFSSEIGVFNSRFQIVYVNSTLNTNSPEFNSNTVIVYKSNQKIVINTSNFEMSNVKLYDVSGRLLSEKNNINSNETIMDAPISNEMIFVKITSKEDGVVTKKIIL